MSAVKLTKATNAEKLCGRCRKSGFVLERGLFKPMFKCQGCDHSWCYGYDGGPYFAHALNVAATTPLDWVDHPDITAARIAGRSALTQEQAK